MRKLIHPSYYDHVVRTGLHHLRWEGVDLWLKDETHQVSGSFKFRGGLNAVLSSAGPAFITASTGNHGAGLARAAQLTGGTTRVVVPHSCPNVKQERIRAAGADVVIHGSDYDKARAEATALAAVTGETYISSFEDARVIRGHAQLFDEACAAGASGVDLTLVPVGGGGLLASALLGAPGRVVGVELDSAPAMSRSLGVGAIQPVDVPVDSHAEGLLVRAVGQLPFRLARARATRVLTVSEAELVAAVRWCWEHVGVRVELAGAAPVAGLMRLLDDTATGWRPQRVLCILTGGNIDADVWERAISVSGGTAGCEASG